MHTLKSKQNVEIAKYLLKKFSYSYVDLYGEENQTYTFHALVYHLADSALNHGSLSEHSMFPLEGTLGLFKEYIKGNRGIGVQFIAGEVKHTWEPKKFRVTKKTGYSGN